MSLADKVLFFCLSFILGIVIASFLKINIFLFYILFLIVAIATIFVWLNILVVKDKKKLISVVLICVVGLVVGFFLFFFFKTKW